MHASLGVPADPAFLLNGWAVVVFLVLMMTIGVPMAFVKGWIFPASTIEAERRRGDTLQDAVNTGLAASREKDQALIELLELARTSSTLLKSLQDERDEAHAQGYVRTTHAGATTEGARS